MLDSAPQKTPNSRYRALLAEGMTGLSVAFDLPTQIGFDSDDLAVADEVGRVGVAIDSWPIWNSSLPASRSTR